MTLYARQLGWLHGTSKIERSKKEGSRSRIDLITEGVDKESHKDEISKRLPFIHPAIDYVTGWLMELGIAGSGSMGPTPLSFTEIDAWARLSGLTLDQWESRALRVMSVGYVSEIVSDNDRPEPMLQSEVPYEEFLEAKAAETERRLERMFAKLEAEQEIEQRRRKKQ